MQLSLREMPARRARPLLLAKAFVIISEEGVAKGIRRITAMTGQCALDAMNLALLLGQEVNDALEAEGSALALEEKVKVLKRRYDEAVIPAASKTEIKANIALLQNKVRKAQKKIAEQNLKKAVKVATEAAESATADGKAFCAIQLDVGFDLVAVREAVLQVKENKGVSIMVFSTDVTTNKVFVCAGVPDQFKQLDSVEWLTTAMCPLNGRCGKGKGKDGLASGQGTDASQLKSALDLAESFAALKLNGVVTTH